jgi:flagellar biosynthesis GTPase FlhF
MRITKFDFADITDGIKSIKEQFGPDALILDIKHNPGKDGNERCTISVASEGKEEGGDAGAYTMPQAEEIARRRTEDVWNLMAKQLIEKTKMMEKDLRRDRIVAYPLAIRGLYEKLTRNGFSQGIATEIISETYVRAGDMAENGFKASLVFKSVLAERIKTVPVTDHGEHILLLGPSGAGKTQTAKKLAVALAAKEKPASIVAYEPVRKGIFEEFMSFSEKTGISFSFVSSERDLFFILENDKRRKIVDLSGHYEIQKKMTAKLGDVPAAMVFSASTRREKIRAYCEDFKETNLLGLILTKLDEESTFGHVFSDLMSLDLPLSFLTHGIEPGDATVPDENALFKLLLEGNLWKKEKL